MSKFGFCHFDNTCLNLSTEIDELYNKKRQLTTNFNKEKNEYYATLKGSRAEAVQQRKTEALKRAEERNAERQVQLDEMYVQLIRDRNWKLFSLDIHTNNYSGLQVLPVFY